jgi:hypothetical protein
MHRFLRELKDVCLSSMPGNRPFWDGVKSLGMSITLIRKAEATKEVSGQVRPVLSRALMLSYRA